MRRRMLSRRLVAVASASVVAGTMSVIGVVISSGPAVADTTPFTAYCPATTIGDIALAGTTVTGSLAPNPVNSGSTATITPTVNVQLPVGLVNAAVGLGNTQIAGYLSGQIDVGGGSPSSVAIGGPSTAPTALYTGIGSFSVPITAGNPANISITMSPITVTAGNSGNLSVAVHSSLTVFDLVNAGPPATYLPLTCSPVNPTAVGTGASTGAGPGITLGDSGPISVPGGVSQALAAGSALMVSDGTNAVLATVQSAVASGGTSIPVQTGAGGAWTAKAAVAAANQVLLLTPTNETISSVPITPVPVATATPNSVSFLTQTASTPISVTGANWLANQTTGCTLSWTHGSDTGTCSTDGSGNLTGTINASVSGEQGTNVVPFGDTITVSALDQAGNAATAAASVQIAPFVSLDSFCTPTSGNLNPSNPGALLPPSGATSPENPLSITRGAGANLYTGASTQLPAPGNAYSTSTPPTASVGCDPRQQINAFVLGSSLYVWANQALPNSDASHVTLSPVQLGLDTNSAANGGNLPPCAPPFPGNPACTPTVNNGQFSQALGLLNPITVQDDRGTLTGWTVTGQMESDFNNVAANHTGPAIDNVIPADFLTWDPSVVLATAGTLPGGNLNTAGSPCQSPAPAQLPTCITGPSGLPQPVGGGAGVNGTGTGTGGSSSQPAEVNAGVPAPLNNLSGSADVLCATDLSLAGGNAGGGGSFDCNAGLALAIPPYVAAGQYQATIDLIILGF